MSIAETILKPDLAKYKKLVRDAADSGSDEIPPFEILEELGKTSTDFADTRDRYLARRQAIKKLREADELDEQAALIKIPTPADAGATKLSEIETVSELQEILQRLKNPYTVVPVEKSQRLELQQRAAAIRGEAASVLATTADPEIRDKISSKREWIANLQRRIDSRKLIAAQAAKVQLLRDRLDAIARGRRHPDNREDVLPEQQREAIEKALAGLPADALQQAKQLAVGGGKDEKQVKEAQVEISRLQSQGRKLDCMKWSE